MINRNPFHDFWFDKETREIYIVSLRVSKPPRDAYKYSNDYAYADNLGDRDALFYIYALLSRYYPAANIQIYYSDDFIDSVRDWEKKNILIVGGPSSLHKVSQFFMYEALPIVYKNVKPKLPQFWYPPKFSADLKPHENRSYSKERLCPECNIIKKCVRHAFCIKENNQGRLIMPEIWEEVSMLKSNIGNENEFDTDRVLRELGNGKIVISGCVKKDIGLFATFTNPFDGEAKNKVVMIQGIFTFGVLGTCQAMSADKLFSLENYNKLYYEFIDLNSKDFIAYFDIEINEQREVRPSRLDTTKVINLSDNENSHKIENIFISYRRKNGQESANKIFELLKSNSAKKIHPFIDLRSDNSSFIPGINYVKEIQNKIAKSDIFLSIISPDCFVTDAGTEGGYKAEWFWAVKTKQTIIPIECDANYFEELNKIKQEIITFFGEDTFKELTRLNAVKILQSNLVETIEQKLKNHYHY